MTTTAWTRTRFCFTATAVTALALLVGGCSSSRSTAGSKSPLAGGTFKFSLPAPITSFNPYASQMGLVMANYAYDPLVNLSPTGELVSGLASKWTATSRSALFTLRKGITCADGTVLTATDVARSLTYAADPKNQLAGALLFLPSIPFTVTGNDRTGTVSVAMSAPYSFIANTVGALPVVCPAGLKDPKSMGRASQGTGPYVLSSYGAGGPYKFTVRSGYSWGPGGAGTAEPGQPANVEVSVVQNTATVTNLLLAGRLDAAQVDGTDAARVDGHGFSTATAPTSLGMMFVNERSGHATSNPAVRKALFAALDRQQLANVIVGGHGSPAQDLTAKNAICHADLAAANLPKGDSAQLLAADGWVRGAGGILTKDGQKLRIRIVTSPTLGATLSAVGELVVQTWKALGVDAQLVSEDQTALVKDMFQTSNFEIALGSSPGFPNPAQYVSYFSGPASPNGLNIGGVQNGEYLQLARQALQTAGTASCATWNQAVASLFRNGDVMVIADGTQTWFGNKASFSLFLGLVPSPASLRLYK